MANTKLANALFEFSSSVYSLEELLGVALHVSEQLASMLRFMGYPRLHPLSNICLAVHDIG